MLMKKWLLTMALLSLALCIAQAQIAPPYTFDLSDETVFNSQLTATDEDGDGESWHYDSAESSAACNIGGFASDWLISTQGIELNGGETYLISVTCKTDVRWNSQTFYTLFGTSPTMEALTQQVESQSTSINNTTFEEHERGIFTPSEDGTYYIGIHVTNSFSFDNGTFCIQNIEIAVKPEIPASVTATSATAGLNGALEATLQWTNPTTNTDGGSLQELSGVKIYRSTSAYMSASNNYLIATLTDGYNTPGATMEWKDTGLTTPDEYYYMIVPFNSNGNSTATTQTLSTSWIGHDTPQAVTDIVVTGAGDTSAYVTFTLPAEGENGGYVDASATTYKIERRDGNSYSYTVLEEAYAGELPYTDNTLPGLNYYTYRITSTFDGRTGDAATSTATLLGCATLPYSESFNSSSSLDFYTVINANNDSYKWQLDSNWSPQYAKYAGSYYGTESDDWLVTPLFNLEAESVYCLTFDARIASEGSGNEKQFAVYIGTAATTEAMTRELLQTVVSQSTDSTYTLYFSVEQTGKYNIGFYCGGTANSVSLYLDNVTLQESQLLPAAATDVTVVADVNGALKAHVSWNNPTTTNTGTALTRLDKVELLRNGEPVFTSNDAEPGSSMSFDDEVPTDGEYSYSVVAYLDDKAGAESETATAWIGHDTPASVESVTARLNEDGKAEITFTPVTQGANGGYVNLDAIRYRIIRNYGATDEATVAEELQATTYVDSEELPLGNYTYTVFALYEGLESSGTTSNSIIAGGALPLPYFADFYNNDEMALWSSYDANNDDKKWEYDSSQGEWVYDSYSAADDWLYTPPFEVSFAGTHRVTFSAYCGSASYAQTIEVALCSNNTPQADYTVINTFDIDTRMTAEHTLDVEIPTTGRWYIGFHNTTNNSWGVMLTDASVESTIGSGIDDVTNNAKAYYNRIDKQLHFGGDANVTIVNATGSIVYIAEKAHETVNLAGLSDGAYIAVITDGKGYVQRVKFIR